jgi:hypothetical protein
MELLRGRPAFREHEDMLFRDREVYVQALNGILVGAALIGGVSFGSWFQLPSSDVAFGSVEMKQFWVCNTVSFFTAVASMCISIAALLPTPSKYVGEIVRRMRVELGWAAMAFAASLATVTMAFTDAAFVMAGTSFATPDYRGSLSIGCAIFGALAGATTLFILIFRSFVAVLPGRLLRSLIRCCFLRHRLPRDETTARSAYSTNVNLDRHWNTDLAASQGSSGKDLLSSIRKSVDDIIQQQLTSTPGLMALGGCSSSPFLEVGEGGRAPIFHLSGPLKSKHQTHRSLDKKC